MPNNHLDLTVGVPADQSTVGVSAMGSATRFFLELADGHTFDGEYFRGGPSAGDGHDEQWQAQAEWDDRTDKSRYTYHRIVRTDTTVIVTVVAQSG